MPPLKSVAMLLICCSQLPIALQTPSAYASFAFLSELDPPQPPAINATITVANSVTRPGDRTRTESTLANTDQRDLSTPRTLGITVCCPAPLPAHGLTP